MRIPWKLKSKIFRAIDVLNAPSFLYFLQKNVTKRSRLTTLNVDANWQRHKDRLIKYATTGLIFEFGAGKSLAQNLYLSDVVDDQLVVDLNPMIDLNLIETARALLSEKTKLKSKNKILKIDDLKHYGITYRAPFDAAITNLRKESVDACVSTNTLEHIPKNSIIRIFTELRRILKDDGIVSAKIDYSDHYAHTDPSISLLNYLRYTDSEWKKYNHDCHYQNRLRHYDYKEIFVNCGFEIVEEELTYGETRISEELEKLFKDKDSIWSATSSYVVLKK